ncbi:hypothetical protein ZWY2020_021207, partial [Hordeum vulgare]
GNIKYQASEKELRDACEEISPVVSLRVASDKDTGRLRLLREFRGLATLIEQVGILLDMAAAGDAGTVGKRPSDLSESGQDVPPKV